MSDSIPDWLKTDIVCEGPLSIEDFQENQKANTLGKIYFPNGKSYTPGESLVGHDMSPYSLNIQDLYNCIHKWNIREQSVLSLGLVGIVAMGDTVRQPGYTTESSKQRKYNFLGIGFGPEITVLKKIHIQPKEAEFLVVTKHNPAPSKDMPLDYVSRRTSQIASFEAQYNDIHLRVRGIEQVLKGIHRGHIASVDTDEATLDAFEKGVPIIFNHELKYIIETTGVENYNSLIPVWYKHDNQLFGKIE